MHQKGLFGVLVLLLIGLLTSWDMGDAAPMRQPPPTTSAAQLGQSMVRQGYADDFAAAARDNAKKLELAKKLISTLETEKDPSTRYALMSCARDLASAAGDYATASDDIDLMAQEFDTDVLKMKCSAAIVSAKVAMLPEVRTDFLQKTSDLLDALILADRFDQAKSLLDQMQRIAHGVDDSNLQKRLLARAQQFREIDAAYREIQKLGPILASNPNDPAANLKVGRFRCFLKGDWTNGLTNLSLGSDPTIKALADKELVGNLPRSDELKLADGWWDLGDKEKDTAKAQLQRHTVKLYQDVLPQLTGLDKAKAQTRLDQVLAQDKPPQPRDPAQAAEISKTIDALIAMEDHQGGWEGHTDARNYQFGAATGIACLALLTSGDDPDKDDHLRAALDFLIKAQAKGMRAFSARLQVLDLLNAGGARPILQRDTASLFSLQADNFEFSYQPGEGTSIPNCLDGVLGFAAAAHQGIEVPEPRWEHLVDRLSLQQSDDGGWGLCKEGMNQAPHVDPATLVGSTCDALVCLYLARNQIADKAGVALVDKAIDNGLGYMDKQYDPAHTAIADQLAVQEVGLLAQRSDFGTNDWYRAGCDRFIHNPERLREDVFYLSEKLIFFSRGGAR